MIDLLPLTSWLTEVLVLVIATLVFPVLARLYDGLGVSRDSSLRKDFNEAIHTAIEYSVERFSSRIPDTVASRSELVNEAVSWLIKRYPKIIKRFNLTPEDIAESVRARLYSHIPEPEKNDS